jgi:hypothetical protein
MASPEAFYLVRMDRAEIQYLCKRKEGIGARGLPEWKEKKERKSDHFLVRWPSFLYNEQK